MTTQNKSINVRQYLGSLGSFIGATFWGLGAGALFALNIPVLVVLGLAVVWLAIRHESDWIVYVAGVIVGVLLFQFAGVVLPDFIPYVVVIFGALFF